MSAAVQLGAGRVVPLGSHNDQGSEPVGAANVHVREQFGSSLAEPVYLPSAVAVRDWPSVGVPTQPGLPSAEAMKPGDLLRAARARVAHIKTELRRARKLEAELDELERLLAAAQPRRPRRHKKHAEDASAPTNETKTSTRS